MTTRSLTGEPIPRRAANARSSRSACSPSSSPVQSPPQPQPIDANARTTAGVTIPFRSRERSTYGRLRGSWTAPQPTYGFSFGLRSIACPYAWFDQLPLPLPHGDGTARRQWNEPVMSPSAGRARFGPYMSSSRMCRIGNFSSWSLRKTVTSLRAESRFTTSCPVRSRPSKPQCVTVSSRRSESGTGHPGRQKRPSQVPLERRRERLDRRVVCRRARRARAVGREGEARRPQGCRAGWRCVKAFVLGKVCRGDDSRAS